LNYSYSVMKTLLIAVIIFAIQPAKAPPHKRTAETDSTRNTRGAQRDQTQAAQRTPAVSQSPIGPESQRSTPAANNHTQQSNGQTGNEDSTTQRKLTWFTGVLAGVGVLQLIVMFLTWLVYRRQAQEMRRQRYEMRGQRHVMYRQWKAMGHQVETMDRQLAEMGNQTTALRDSVSTALKNTNAFINKERSLLFIEESVTKDFEATFRVSNKGRSPAQLTYSFVGCEIFSEGETFPDVPDYTRGDPEWVFGRTDWVFPDSKPVLVGDYDAGYISITDNPELFESVMSRQYTVWYYGVLRYIDNLTGEKREIRFCYECWTSKDGKHWLHETGPSAYRGEN
jgi:hypothetical protein